MKWSALYGEWGKLLYAIAACDGKISQKERLKLKQIVAQALADSQRTDEFGSPIPSYILAAFEYDEDELVEPNDVMASFYEFIERHKTALTDEILYNMIDSATQVAESHYGISHREDQLLAETKQAIRKLIQENHLTKTTSS
jgi:hypothetical protein